MWSKKKALPLKWIHLFKSLDKIYLATHIIIQHHRSSSDFRFAFNRAAHQLFVYRSNKALSNISRAVFNGSKRLNFRNKLEILSIPSLLSASKCLFVELRLNILQKYVPASSEKLVTCSVNSFHQEIVNCVTLMKYWHVYLLADIFIFIIMQILHFSIILSISSKLKFLQLP